MQIGRITKTLLVLMAIQFAIPSVAQNTYLLKGIIIDDAGDTVPFATIEAKKNNKATASDKNGFFELLLTSLPDTLIIKSVGFNTINYPLTDQSNRKNLTITLSIKSESINEVVVTGNGKQDGSFQKLNAKNQTLLPDASGGNIESLVKTQMGVTSNNEMSSQYRVRGGNFDENSIYVNDIEIYRPFLVRSGQQEGLSFVNPDLISELSFSAGGFDTKYNDKMSSVLDIAYKKPTNFAASAAMSLMGASVHAEGGSKNGKFNAIFGSRYKTNKMLLGTLDTKGEYEPTFYDFQTYLNYQFSNRWALGILGYYGFTGYEFQPVSRETSFGTLAEMKSLYIYFDGNEEDQFVSGMGAATLSFSPNYNNKISLIASSYLTHESETFDILNQYWLQDLDPSQSSNAPSTTGNAKDIGSNLNHARNYLDGAVNNIAVRGTHSIENHKICWEGKVQYEKFDETISEWSYIDSAGYSLPHNGTSINLQKNYKATINTNTQRVTSFIQDDYTFFTNKGKISLSGGIRFNYWNFNNQLLVSPRGAIAFVPDATPNLSIRFATGVYYQSPFLKELHSPNGTMNYNIKAQKSIQYVLASSYTFTGYKRPFKLSTEIYYKHLSDLNPYTIDNVRIIYSGTNNAKGYATGIDFKINGELVEGLESWATLSFMKTEENLLNDVGSTKQPDGTTTYFSPGYIPRPSDQRVNFSLFFQDYIPKYPSYKVHLNLLFGTGLPFGPPDAPRYMATLRMPPYRRVDIGFSKEITGSQNNPNKVLGPLKKLWLGVDVFNLFNISNTISYYWVTDIDNQQYAVPNYLTSRRVNFKIVANF